MYPFDNKIGAPYLESSNIIWNDLSEEDIQLCRNTPYKNLNNIRYDINGIEEVSDTYLSRYNNGVGLIEFMAYINHLGNDNVIYILNNLNEYLSLLNDWSMKFAVLTEDALNRLITINMYRKARGKPHKLPKLTKKQFNAVYSAVNTAVIKQYGKK